GLRRPEGEYSSIDILEPPYSTNNSYLLDGEKPFGPEVLWRRYTADDPKDFYSQNISSAQLLKNGNILICEGAKGKFFEINQDNKIVWAFVNTFANISDQPTERRKSPIFKCVFYESSFPGLNVIFQARTNEIPER
ncbi:MAG: hypothetical protein JNL60_17590, partial [Bacteroidia bacterium]|nr:hypothetical protein [Bacteroidia bacterium]